ncbi:MAG: efflux transporter periplasmic adaptor subunit, partial [Pyrinomonadaceae bacterium]|nr:efflux transporter periplasmic adaptor subunit [Pyrinomonadaceae bacterium]
SSSIYVIESGNNGDTARLRVVQRGGEEDDRVRIISGLNGGETIATSNLDQLYDGAKVVRR